MENILPGVAGQNELIQTVKDGRGVVADAMDACIKGLDFAKEIGEATPFGWAIKLFDVHSTYKANRLQRNVTSYLEETDRLSDGQKNEFTRKLQSDVQFSNEFAEVTLLIWNESEKPIKSKMVGKLSYHMAIEDITKEQFVKLSLLIYSASVPAINALSTFLESNEFKPNTHKHRFEEEPLLFSSGFGSRFGSGFNLSEDAKQIITYGLEIKLNAS
jgi:hypothetical protein